MAGVLVFFLVEIFLLGIASGQTTPGLGCSVPCSECKIITEGNYEGSWSLKSVVDSRCPDMCLYQKYTDGTETEMCFCDPGPIEYESCKRMLVVTGGDGPQPFSSSEIISYNDVCSSPNIPPLPKETSAGKSVWIHDSTLLMFCGGSQTYDGGAPDSAGWGATDICWKHSPGDTDWTSDPISNMNFNRSWFSLNSNDANEAVAAGGLDYNGTVWDTLEKYSGGVWNVLPITLDNPTYGHCAVHYSLGGNSYLMIIGGSNTFDDYWNLSASASVTQIDLTANKKVSVAPGPLPALWAPACTIHGEDIYVSGGGIPDFNQAIAIPTTGVYKYNLNDGQFTHQGNLTAPRWGATMGVTAEGQLVVAGGWDQNDPQTYLASIESSGDDGATWVTRDTSLSQGVEYQAMAYVPLKCQ